MKLSKVHVRKQQRKIKRDAERRAKNRLTLPVKK